MTSLANALRSIERRLKNLEKLSHKQPNMKEIIKDIAAVMRHKERKSPKPRKTIARVQRPPGVRC